MGRFQEDPLASFAGFLVLIWSLVLFAARSAKYREALQACQAKTGLPTLIQRVIVIDALVKKSKNEAISEAFYEDVIFSMADRYSL